MNNKTKKEISTIEMIDKIKENMDNNYQHLEYIRDIICSDNVDLYFENVLMLCRIVEEVSSENIKGEYCLNCEYYNGFKQKCSFREEKTVEPLFHCDFYVECDVDTLIDNSIAFDEYVERLVEDIRNQISMLIDDF